jgi:hypothetical protein
MWAGDEFRSLRNQRCFAHNPLRGSTTQRKLTTPDSPKRLQRQHTHNRHATPAPAHTTPAHSDLLRTACAPTSTHSNGFCVIWVCISSSSRSNFSRSLSRQEPVEWKMYRTMYPPVCCVLALLIWNIPDDDLIKQVLHL